MRILLPFIVLTIFIQFSSSLTFEEYVTVNKEQKNALDELKSRVIHNLPHDYMKEEIYLIRFLRETDFEVATAEKLLLDSLKWREDNKVEELTKPGSLDTVERDMEEFQPRLQGCDREGRPVMAINFGDGNMRKLVVAGKSQEMLKGFIAIFENAVTFIRDSQKQGENFAQLSAILDLKGFSPATHACPLCISLYLETFAIIQFRYLGYAHRVYVINMPNYALPLWNVVRSFLTPKLRDTFYLYGVNKEEWTKALFRDIDPSQLAKRYGGTKTWSLNPFDIVRSGKTFTCRLTEDDIYS